MLPHNLPYTYRRFALKFSLRFFPIIPVSFIKDNRKWPSSSIFGPLLWTLAFSASNVYSCYHFLRNQSYGRRKELILFRLQAQWDLFVMVKILVFTLHFSLSASFCFVCFRGALTTVSGLRCFLWPLVYNIG